jgi:alanine racemase
MSHVPTTAPVSVDCHRTWVELDAAALRHNAGVARQLAGPDGGVIAVVKANAYGLGVSSVVPELAAAGVDAFAVATLDEARRVHALGVTQPIYLLSPALPAERPAIVAADFTVIPAVSSFEEAIRYASLAIEARKTLPVHLVLDTGMGRIGLKATFAEYVSTDAKPLTELSGLRLDSVASHFPSADEDPGFTEQQLAHYHLLLAHLAQEGVAPPHHHVANSAGTLTLARSGREWVRTGLLLYGVSPVPEKQGLLREVVTWHARVILTRTLPAGHGVSYGRTFVTDRPTRVATLAVGYADGYPRHLSGQGAWVWLGGRRCPVLGRVTMDQIMVEAPEHVQPGDTATLLGDHGPAASELAARAGTIPYEIFCGLGPRVARVVNR